VAILPTKAIVHQIEATVTGFIRPNNLRQPVRYYLDITYGVLAKLAARRILSSTIGLTLYVL
jgi:hypothetical protein